MLVDLQEQLAQVGGVLTTGNAAAPICCCWCCTPGWLQCAPSPTNQLTNQPIDKQTNTNHQQLQPAN